jgi:hypothetical protein
MSSLESAQALAARDPTVLAHRNTVDVHAWQGPPGIGVEYFRLHKQDPKTPENMQSHPLCLLYRGTGWDEKRNTREQMLTAHERYVDRLHSLGKLGVVQRSRAPLIIKDHPSGLMKIPLNFSPYFALMSQSVRKANHGRDSPGDLQIPQRAHRSIAC